MPSLPNRPREGLLAWLDALQRRHGVLGFPFAVIRKYGDDGGWRHAALITYYGFLSVFPILLVAASLLSAVLVNRPTLRQEMVAALLPEALQSTVNTALAAMPSSGLPLALGIVGLLFSGTGVVFSAYETLNQVAGVPRRSRFPVVARYTRVVLMVIVVLVGGLGIAALTVASGALPDELQRLGGQPRHGTGGVPRPRYRRRTVGGQTGSAADERVARSNGRHRRHPRSRARRAVAGSARGEVGPGVRELRDGGGDLHAAVPRQPGAPVRRGGRRRSAPRPVASRDGHVEADTGRHLGTHLAGDRAGADSRRADRGAVRPP